LKHLFEELEKNAAGDIYPYHMPGHKRRECGSLPEALYINDITEIEGFDNLHQPEGLLLALQREAARLYGAEESFYLVNGSTCGILSAVSCVLPSGGHILMARNCHKSAYHGAYLRNLAITYLYPPYLTEYDIFDAVTPQQVEETLEQETDIGAVLIVSPTYEGRIADIREIADIVHCKGIPLIVDEAHGAHLGLAEGLPPNSCRQGADLVIHSVHKTLPALTQTALLHVNGSLVDRRMLKRFLHIYQSSSPSYLLMASIDNALQYMEREGGEAFRRFQERYGYMMGELAECRHLRFLPCDGKKQDIGKLLISVKGTELTGKRLNDILLQRYHLQMEMASESYVLAMFTVNDGEEAYSRMTKALLAIDRELDVQFRGQDCIVMSGKDEHRQKSGGLPTRCEEACIQGRGSDMGCREAGIQNVDLVTGCEEACVRSRGSDAGCEEACAQGVEMVTGCEEACAQGVEMATGCEEACAQGVEMVTGCEEACVQSRGLATGCEEAEAACSEWGIRCGKAGVLHSESLRGIPLAEAWDRAVETVALEDSVGRYAGEFVNRYPPGVPLLVPGERITDAICRGIRQDILQGLTLQGVETDENKGGTETAMGKRLTINVLITE